MGLHFGDDDCGKDPTIPHFEFFLVARERAQIRPVNILRTVEHRIGETAVGVQAIKELCALHQVDAAMAVSHEIMDILYNDFRETFRQLWKDILQDPVIKPGEIEVTATSTSYDEFVFDSIAPAGMSTSEYLASFGKFLWGCRQEVYRRNMQAPANRLTIAPDIWPLVSQQETCTEGQGLICETLYGKKFVGRIMRLDLDVYINPLQQGSTGMLYHDQSPEQVVWFTVREEKPKESTMKILRRGIPKSEHLFEGECSHCKSVMQEKRGNLKPTQDQRDGEFAHATCPVCGADFVMHPCGGYCAGTK